MIRSDKEKYWRDRASRYSGFKWANDHGYKWAFINACEFQPRDWVLDVGCGPGIISQAIYPIVDRVIGLDNSREMLTQGDGLVNLMFGKAEDIPFPDQTFDKVLARNVFHHMTKNLKDGMRECRRVLKPGGRIIIGERVPPADSKQVYIEYREMLRLKDERIIFDEDKLSYFLISSGFGNLRFLPFWIKGFNVREWLENSGLDDAVQAEIWNRHVNGSQEFKKASHMRGSVSPRGGGEETREDCVIDIKNLIVIGEAK